MSGKKELDIIDLTELLLKKASKKISHFFSFVLRFLTFVFSRYYLSLGIVLLVGGFFFLRYLQKEDVYTSYATISLQVSNSTEVAAIINQLNRSKQTNLAERLNCNIDQVSQIESITPYFLIDIDDDGYADYADMSQGSDIQTPYHTKEGERRIKDKILLKARVKDTALFSLLNQHLLEAIQTPYILDLNKTRLAILTTNIESLSEEIEKLDQYQRKEYFEYRRNDTPNNNTLNIRTSSDERNELFHEDLLKLKERHSRQLNAFNTEEEAFLYIDTFTVPTDPDKIRLQYLIYFISSTFLILFVVFLFTLGRKQQKEHV